jgi:hypothetical protein
MHGVHETTGPDRQAVLLGEQGGDVGKGQPSCLLESPPGRRLGAESRRGGAERIGILQRVPALHAPSTAIRVHDFVNSGLRKRSL